MSGWSSSGISTPLHWRHSWKNTITCRSDADQMQIRCTDCTEGSQGKPSSPADCLHPTSVPAQHLHPHSDCPKVTQSYAVSLAYPMYPITGLSLYPVHCLSLCTIPCTLACPCIYLFGPPHRSTAPMFQRAWQRVHRWCNKRCNTGPQVPRTECCAGDKVNV